MSPCFPCCNLSRKAEFQRESYWPRGFYAARAALDAEPAGGADQNFFTRFWAGLRRLVSVRRVGNVEGTANEDDLARAQVYCDLGDIAGAVMEAQAVSGPAAMPLESWIKSAEARLAVDSAVTEMNARIVQALAASAAPAQSSGPPP